MAILWPVGQDHFANLAEHDAATPQARPVDWHRIRIEAERQEAAYRRAEDAVVYDEPSREPKSIHAHVRSYSMPKPRHGAGRIKESEPGSFARTGRYTSDARGWRRIPRT